jgi:hypothetical protein
VVVFDMKGVGVCMCVYVYLYTYMYACTTSRCI